MKYDDYFKSQTERFLSFESDNGVWKEGQCVFLNKYFVDFDKNLHILDVACGDGVGLSWFKEKEFKNVFGVEFSQQKHDIAKTYGYPVLQSDMHSLAYEDKSFDIVYSSHTLEHSYDPSKALSEWNRILKDDGLLILVLPYPDSGDDEAHLGKFKLKTVVTDRTRNQAEDLCDYLLQNNFEVISKEFDHYRQPEVWLRLKKNDRNRQKPA
jgi:ubiquinone/menaquinone biosynthesis C-methylase UbiE